MLAERHRESGETQGERRDAGREERHRESKETQEQPVQLRRDRYTGHIQGAVYVTRPGLASDIPGLSPRLEYNRTLTKSAGGYTEIK